MSNRLSRWMRRRRLQTQRVQLQGIGLTCEEAARVLPDWVEFEPPMRRIDRLRLRDAK